MSKLLIHGQDRRKDGQWIDFYGLYDSLEEFQRRVQYDALAPRYMETRLVKVIREV
jgi:hypothetical protein